MATHKSAIKRQRQTEKRRLLNKYKHKTARNSVRKLLGLTKKKEAIALLPSIISMVDKLGKRNIVHKNKVANLKSKLTRHVNSLT